MQPQSPDTFPRRQTADGSRSVDRSIGCESQDQVHSILMEKMKKKKKKQTKKQMAMPQELINRQQTAASTVK
jgi:hypothetical protein